MGHVFALIAIATWAAILMAWGLCDLARQGRPLARRVARTLLRALSLLAEGFARAGDWLAAWVLVARAGRHAGDGQHPAAVRRDPFGPAPQPAWAAPSMLPIRPQRDEPTLVDCTPMVRVGSFIGHEHSWSDRRWN